MVEAQKGREREKDRKEGRERERDGLIMIRLKMGAMDKMWF